MLLVRHKDSSPEAYLLPQNVFRTRDQEMIKTARALLGRHSGGVASGISYYGRTLSLLVVQKDNIPTNVLLPVNVAARRG